MRPSPRWIPRAVALSFVVTALSCVPHAGAAVAPVSISGTDRDVWNIARPVATYTVSTATARAAVTWKVTGPVASTGKGTSPVSVRLTGLKSGSYTLQATSGTATATRKFRVDLAAPGLTIRTPTANAWYLPGQAVVADYACSGAVSCVGPVPSGQMLDTGSAGARTFTVVATDDAGNVTTRSVDYRVGPGLLSIATRPAGPARNARPTFGWNGGEPGAVYTWQVVTAGTVIAQGDTLAPSVTIGPLAAGSYAFQVRQTVEGRTGPYGAPDPFTILPGARADAGPTRPQTLNPRRLRPAAGARSTSSRPLLSWRPVKGARFYNLQVFRIRGTTAIQVVSAFPRGTKRRVAGLRYGERYAWRVWPHFGGRSGYSKHPVGISFFDVSRPVRVNAGQMLTARRTAQAAMFRVQAVERWLDHGITAGDLRHQGLGVAVFAPALAATGTPTGTGVSAAAVRPFSSGTIPKAALATRVPVTRRALVSTRRLAEAAARRMAAVEARLAAGLTGGDIADGSIGPEKLAPGVALASPAAASAPPPPAAGTPRAVKPAAVRLTAASLRSSQALSEAVMARADRVRDRLSEGLSTADFQPGSITSADLAPSLRGR